MSERVPIVRQLNWWVILLQCVLIYGLIRAGSWAFPDAGPLAWIGGLLAWSIGVKYLLARDHRAGIGYVKKQCFEEAIPRFLNSLEFFDRYPWIDRFRAIVFMSSSYASYREMALLNVAFCYSQIGDGKRSREYYEQCLERFPNSGMAKSALRMIDAQRSRPDE